MVHKDAIKLLLFELFQEPDVKKALVWGEYPSSFSTNLEIDSNYDAMDELEVYISKDRLSVMLDSGDSPTFIARRLAIFASEEVGKSLIILRVESSIEVILNKYLTPLQKIGQSFRVPHLVSANLYQSTDDFIGLPF